ncbi:MAG TPA: rod shape-determining protein RodA, partial [Bacteroidales bacterium]|nr:rod shape-determining protein RodA [Bacteroidales bacterium]
MNKNRSIISGIDWWTILLFLVIAIFGWLNIYGAGYSFDQTGIWDFSNRAGKQLVWLATAIVLGIIIMMIDEKTYDVLAYILYGAMLLLLAITPLVANNVKGSYSWITLGPISLQPAEFAKCVTALAVAKYMGRYEYRLRDWRDLIVPFALIGVPMLIIMVAQRETGSALVFLSFLLVFYRQRMSGYVLLFGVTSIVLFLIVIYFGGTSLPFGAGNVGILASTLVIETIVTGWLLLKDKNIKSVIFIASGIALIYGVGALLCIWFPINFNYVGIISLVYTAGYLAITTIIT